MSKFNEKTFNGEAFGKYVDRIPNLKRNELLKSRALKRNAQIAEAFSSQTGTGYAIIPFFGNLGGVPVNYDGKTNIDSEATDTYERGVVVTGRAKAWTEDDFSYDITGGVDFMDNVAAQVAEYWAGIDQETLLAVLQGIFAMTGADNLKFVNGHTLDISKEAFTKGYVSATTLNSAAQKACRDNKSKFSLIVMHSSVATNLENLKLLSYLKFTDKDGIERELNLATWNGRLVLVDNSMPVSLIDSLYVRCNSTDVGALKVTTAGEGLGEVALATVQEDISDIKENEYVQHIQNEAIYTSYLLGEGAIDYENIGAKVPSEMSRDPKTNGGQTTLYSRQRKVFAPYGISYTKSSQASLSPTDDELKAGANWELVNNKSTSKKKYINHKAIPIARIISRG
jgi:prophage lp2 protein 40